jgi:hypothetical protein
MPLETESNRVDEEEEEDEKRGCGERMRREEEEKEEEETRSGLAVQTRQLDWFVQPRQLWRIKAPGLTKSSSSSLLSAES